VEYEDFRATLKRLGLTLKDFSRLSGVQYGTCSKWGKNGRPVSDWVESWLRLYEKGVECEELVDKLRGVVCGENGLMNGRYENGTV